MNTVLFVGIAFIVIAALIIGASLKKSNKKATGKGTGAGNGGDTDIQKPFKY